ncbi:MAG: hypothetical protein ACYS7Y_03990 [Planctomycetota bacterium]|jgi:hypothetical protein
MTYLVAAIYSAALIPLCYWFWLGKKRYEDMYLKMVVEEVDRKREEAEVHNLVCAATVDGWEVNITRHEEQWFAVWSKGAPRGLPYGAKADYLHAAIMGAAMAAGIENNYEDTWEVDDVV